MKIEIQNLCKTIKKVPILQDITVTFESGKIYGLKGKNGSGKTMLMRAISGLIIPNSGTINIDGEILGKDISFPRSIGILIENPSFLGNYTGYKNLEMLASIQNRIGEDEIRETLAEVGLDPDDKRTYRKYSDNSFLKFHMILLMSCLSSSLFHFILLFFKTHLPRKRNFFSSGVNAFFLYLKWGVQTAEMIFQTCSKDITN